MGTMLHRRGTQSLMIFALALRTLSPSVTAQESSCSKASAKTEQRIKAARSRSDAADTNPYRDTDFALTYKTPYGWVDRTQQMQDPENDSSKSKLLLAVFERPPEAVGDTINSAVVIAAESASSYPGLKTAADYIGPLTELTTSKGFKVVGEPYETSVGTTTLVRLDCTRELGKLTMHQSSLVLLRNKFVVSFTFIAGSTDELDELIEKLSFDTPKSK
jgi:hypothetical protein